MAFIGFEPKLNQKSFQAENFTSLVLFISEIVEESPPPLHVKILAGIPTHVLVICFYKYHTLRQ